MTLGHALGVCVCGGAPDRYDMEVTSAMWGPGLAWPVELNQVATGEASHRPNSQAKPGLSNVDVVYREPGMRHHRL